LRPGIIQHFADRFGQIRFDGMAVFSEHGFPC
jgi:hypothetical protein